VNVTWATRVEPAGGRNLRHRTILTGILTASAVQDCPSASTVADSEGETETNSLPVTAAPMPIDTAYRQQVGYAASR
jgi:hypothetical protein